MDLLHLKFVGGAIALPAAARDDRTAPKNGLPIEQCGTNSIVVVGTFIKQRLIFCAFPEYTR